MTPDAVAWNHFVYWFWLVLIPSLIGWSVLAGVWLYDRRHERP